MKKLIIIIFLTVLVGIALSQPGAGVIRRFINLTDTPSTYSGQAGKVLVVNSGGNAVEFSSENYLTETEIDASSELAALMDDETGTGLLVFNTDPDFTTGISVNTTTASDPYIEFKTTNTAHEIDVYLDESSVGDELKIEGKTPSVNTTLSIIGQDGQNGVLYLYSGSLFSYIAALSDDRLHIANNNQDKDIFFQINDGGVTKTITWDADVDKLKHSGGTFDFDDDGLTTTGTIEGGTITEGGVGVLNSQEIDTYSELNAIVADVTLTHNGLIDTFAELDAIVANKALVNQSDGATWTGTHNFTGGAVSLPKRTKNDDKFYCFNLWNPNALYDDDTQVCIEPNLPAAITITEVQITCGADPTTELDWDLKFADAFIGLANATLIVACDTTNGAADIDSGWNDNTIPASKCLYMEFGADPDSGIKQVIVKIRFDYD